MAIRFRAPALLLALTLLACSGGASDAPPAEEADYDSWFEQLLLILREMGLLPTGTD